MTASSTVVWVLLAVLCLAAGLGWVGLRRGAHWGRTRTSIPASALGFGLVLATLAVLVAAGFGLLPFEAIFLAPLLALLGAVLDSWRAGREPPRDGKP